MELLTTEHVIPKSINQVSIVLSNDAELRALNKTYRNLDKTTDVLSFSMLEGEAANDPLDELGDVVISVDMAIKQSKRFKCSLPYEVLRLITHGCLHLFGYDHVKVSPKKVRIMKELEEKLIRRYGKDLVRSRSVIF